MPVVSRPIVLVVIALATAISRECFSFSNRDCTGRSRLIQVFGYEGSQRK